MTTVNPEWLKKFDEKPEPSRLLVQFLEDCKHLDISRGLGNEESIEKAVLMVRMTAKHVVWRIFAIHIDRSIEIPWKLPHSIRVRPKSRSAKTKA